MNLEKARKLRCFITCDCPKRYEEVLEILSSKLSPFKPDSFRSEEDFGFMIINEGNFTTGNLPSFPSNYRISDAGELISRGELCIISSKSFLNDNRTIKSN